MTMPDTYLNATQVADALGLSPATLANWRVLGRGPCFVRVGRSIRYRLADVEAWTDARTATSTSDADQRGCR